jgi:HEAT repeat protein
MPSSSFPALATAILIGTIAGGFAIAQAVHRRSRRRARLRARELVLLLSGHLDRRVPARRLKHAADAAEAAVFWSALEELSLGLGRRQMVALGVVLERNRHARLERYALKEDSPWRRELAARRLALLTSPASRRALRAALVQGPEIVRLAAATGLARARDARALRWILDHPGSLGRRGVPLLTALLRSFGRGALPILADALERHPGHLALEIALIETLGLGRLRAAAPAIARLLERDDLDLRAASARALGRIGADECAGPLLIALADPAWPVRAQAARALGRARVLAAIQPLAACLTDRSWWVRRHAAYALAELDDPGRTALAFAARTSHDPYAREIAREALEGGLRLRA